MAKKARLLLLVMWSATVPHPQNPVAHQENIFVWVLIGRNEEEASDNHLMSRLCGDIWIINQDLGPGRGGSNNIYLGKDSMTNMARLRKWPAHTGHSGPCWPSRSWAGLSRYKLKQSGWAGGWGRDTVTCRSLTGTFTPAARYDLQAVLMKLLQRSMEVKASW